MTSENSSATRDFMVNEADSTDQTSQFDLDTTTEDDLQSVNMDEQNDSMIIDLGKLADQTDDGETKKCFLPRIFSTYDQAFLMSLGL